MVSKYLEQVKGDLYAVNLWHYRKETVTKWHYDAHDNFLFQIKGRK
jgi:ribosomal protein L16 Arg81 hydroxylase